MAQYDDLPYRPCVGIMLINQDGLVFIGRRASGPEHIDATHVWQMPQGGIDRGEDTWRAALRELAEETSIRSVEKLGEIDRALAQLEATARQRGYAVGVASALPLSIERLNAWAKAVEDHGILLVPLTTVMTKSKSS